jgi:hypothetical protein
VPRWRPFGPPPRGPASLRSRPASRTLGVLARDPTNFNHEQPQPIQTVARPTTSTVAAAEPKPRKLSAKERKVAERDTPKVANARRVLDRMSESLAPEAALPPAPATPLRMAEEASKVCSYHKRPEPLTAFASNAAHAHLQSACREAEKIRRDARKAKAAK